MKIIFKNFIHLNENEHKTILNLRNSYNIRKQMKTDKIIQIKEHIAWANNLQNDKKNIYFAIYHNETIIGGASISHVDFKTKSSSWGFYFHEQTSPLIKSICVYVLIEKIFNMGMEKIISEVKLTNKNAYKFNKSFGFVDVEKRSGYYILELLKCKWGKNKPRVLEKRASNVQFT